MTRTSQHPRNLVKVWQQSLEQTDSDGVFSAAAITRKSTEVMPPPRATRSTTAQLSRQSVEEDDELGDLTDVDELAAKISSRQKLSTSAGSGRRR